MLLILLYIYMLIVKFRLSSAYLALGKPDRNEVRSGGLLSIPSMINTPGSPVQRPDGCTYSGVVKIGR